MKKCIIFAFEITLYTLRRIAALWITEILALTVRICVFCMPLGEGSVSLTVLHEWTFFGKHYLDIMGDFFYVFRWKIHVNVFFSHVIIHGIVLKNPWFQCPPLLG